MNRPDDTLSPEARRRIDELLADDALGNLDAQDAAELRDLGAPGNPLHAVVASLSEAIIPEATMSLSLQNRIEADAAQFLGVSQADRQPARRSTVRTASTRSGTNFNLAAWLGWGVAAAACVALGLTLARPDPAAQVVVKEVIREVPAPTPKQPTPAEARAAMLAGSETLIRAGWDKGNTEDTVRGDVVWSSDRQSGFMRLAGLPALPPGFQYQLWIIDAAREGQAPVDGGVFDIAQSANGQSTGAPTGEVIIPFYAKLKVTQPAAFAITIERAGGVPVSKQEKVAALAKPA